MRACVRDVFAAIYDSNISPRLIMIIIKITILYFLQVRRNDDFPSTGNRLVQLTIVRQPFLLEGQAGCQEIDSGPHVHYISLP